MDAAELDRRFRTYQGWIPPTVVAVLAACGYGEEMRRQAERGDWFCARALAKDERPEKALELLAPFVESGWWEAVATVARMLEEWGRTEEALTLVRTRMDAGERRAVELLAELLARQDRIDEVIALLGPRAANESYARTLVELTEGHGRDDEVAGLLPAVEDGCRCPDFFGDKWNATELTARVLERQGRVDEAVALLRPAVMCCGVGYGNVVDHLADVLARHDRLAELREFVAGDGGEDAAERLARALEERGLVDEAVGVLRPFAAQGSPNAAWEAARLLERHGRVGEAIKVLRSVTVSMADPEWLIWRLVTLVADHGRADDALTMLDEIADELGGMSTELFHERVRLLVHCGRQEQAIAELRARPGGGGRALAELLAETGRFDEAVAVLERRDQSPANLFDLAGLMLRQGRVREATELLREHVDPTEIRWSEVPPSDHPNGTATSTSPSPAAGDTTAETRTAVALATLPARTRPARAGRAARTRSVLAAAARSARAAFTGAAVALASAGSAAASPAPRRPNRRAGRGC